ncbi:MAG TPA: FAD-dependent oxidoreductase [Anaerolineae bacterium]|nr:FAD-dependent oxidoreductase [Anaerolineae bacterium]
MGKQTDVLVIGAGLAGLTAAWQAVGRGKKVKVLAKGWGATHWHSGCIDLLGYWPLAADTAVTNPLQAIEQLIVENPQHPYALAGLDNITVAVNAFQALCAEAGYPLEGSPEKNWLLPTAVGTFRPTCLAPQTMTAGDLSDDAPMLLVGFEQFVDFYPHVAADNLTQQGIPAEYVMLDLPSLARQRRLTSVVLANMMEQETFRQEVAQALKPKLGQAARVGFPAVLGLRGLRPSGKRCLICWSGRFLKFLPCRHRWPGFGCTTFCRMRFRRREAGCLTAWKRWGRRWMGAG